MKYQLRVRFKVKIACGRKQSHYLDGYGGTSVQIHVIKYALNVCISLSAALRLWIFGGASWNFVLCSSKPFLRLDYALLSSVCRFG